MVTFAVPDALTPASAQGGVSFCGDIVRLKTFGWGEDSLLPQVTMMASSTRNTGTRTRFIAASSRTDRGTPSTSPRRHGGGRALRAPTDEREPRVEDSTFASLRWAESGRRDSGASLTPSPLPARSV